MSFQPTKCDPELGLAVHDYLVSKGVETPMVIEQVKKKADAKIKKIEKAFTTILEELGMDLTDDSIEETPKRVAKMYVNEIFWGLNPEYFPKCTTIENKMGYDEMVIERDITSMSNCEHHLVTIDARIDIAYIPNKTVLGLSKLNRIAEYFSRRPQVQERLAEQIYHALSFILDTENVAVIIRGTHYCVKMRGVEDHSSSTVTSKMGGSFKDNPTQRSELLELVK